MIRCPRFKVVAFFAVLLFSLLTSGCIRPSGPEDPTSERHVFPITIDCDAPNDLQDIELNRGEVVQFDFSHSGPEIDVRLIFLRETPLYRNGGFRRVVKSKAPGQSKVYKVKGKKGDYEIRLWCGGTEVGANLSPMIQIPREHR